MQLKFQVQARIQKPVAEVFDAVYNPKKLSEYFTNGGSSGPLDEGHEVLWTFADMGGHTQTVSLKVEKTVKNKLIRFKWAANEETYAPEEGKMPTPANYQTTVEIKFEAVEKKGTLVSISEGEWHPTDGGLRGSYDNCGGWMNMNCCLKAYLEYGINLRKGFF
jgi:uncharacterized protein YndB with AHSA1/START domain